MKILITGGAGFIGSHLSEHYVKKGWDVVVVDDLSSGSIYNIPYGAVHVGIDIRNCKHLYEYIQGIDVIVNLAAVASVPESIETPLKAEHVNVCGLIELLEMAGQAKIKTFIQASSAAVYGYGYDTSETSTPQPISPYAITKLAGEHYVRYFAQKHGFDGVSCRFFNVYGPRQKDKGYAAVIPSFIKSALKNEPLRINGDGNQTRDFIYVKDLVNAVDGIIRDSLQRCLLYDCFNIGTGKGITINELAYAITTVTRSTSEIIYGKYLPGEVRNSVAETRRVKEYISEPGYNHNGIGETIEYYRGKL